MNAQSPNGEQKVSMWMIDMRGLIHMLRWDRSAGQDAQRVGLAARATRSERGCAGFRRVWPGSGAVAHLFTYCHRLPLVAALLTRKYFPGYQICQAGLGRENTESA